MIQVKSTVVQFVCDTAIAVSALVLVEDCSDFCLASTLCAEHESIAFIAGLQLGTQLMLELQQSDDN